MLGLLHLRITIQGTHTTHNMSQLGAAIQIIMPDTHTLIR